MSVEKLLTKTKQLADDNVIRKPIRLQADYLDELTALQDKDALDLAARLFFENEWRYIWSSVIIFQKHPTARSAVTPEYLEPLGNRMDSWGLVDAFSAIAGPVWREGYISDETVVGWTRSESRWWRRAALVCTVFLNVKAQGGRGDTQRTLMVCEILTSDKDDMVAKGMSWALRELSKRDPKAVETFVEEHKNELPALVKREVHNKLTLGVKNPRRRNL